MGKPFFKRAFLNNGFDHSVAGIYVSCRRIRPWSKKTKKQIEASIDINDCTRTITLDLYAKNKKDFKNALYKCDTLIETVTALREELIKQWNQPEP